MSINPDIQRYFDYKYVDGDLHIYIRKDFVDELGWNEKDLELSFGGIRRMNDWGQNATLTIHKTTEYVHPWDRINEEELRQTKVGLTGW